MGYTVFTSFVLGFAGWRYTVIKGETKKERRRKGNGRDEEELELVVK